ncbi:hypothetical protein HMPREF1870_02858 [Bacteroidales bacterium KA00344]|nr:hypothetical protein HMPREF1870_02858 [Bacteroidales bacterium KA00344]
MMNNMVLRIVFMICMGVITTSLHAKSIGKVTSPDGNLTVTVSLSKTGRPYFTLHRGAEMILDKSQMGMKLKSGDFYQNFKVLSSKCDRKDETWQQPWGEETEVRNHYNELSVNLQEKRGAKRLLTLVFRVFNDGMGFRYVFPKQPNLKNFVIMDEMTEMALPTDNDAWTIPVEGTEFLEALWTKEKMSTKPRVYTPITMEVKDDLYLVFHEANLTDYAMLNYEAKANGKGGVTMKSELTPWSTGELVFASAPFKSPWRTVIVGSKPADLIASRLMLNLNDPCKIEDTSWLETGKYVGIWWGMHMEDYTWGQGEKHGANTANTKRYIDFAAENGFKGVLVEGWNEGWDGDWGSNGDLFSFTKAYPDYDLPGLQQYAMNKGVRLIAHNETSGGAKNYEAQLEDAFALYHSLGIKAVKTGYVKKLMDKKELQHSQYGIRHYRKVIETAAKYQLMIVNHEPAMPTGLRRTYPNLISAEGTRGQEYNAWSKDGGNPPYHICILPFTRQLAGPIDFTPGIFNFKNKVYPKTHPQTTLTKQLAEYIVIYSPWQMAADMIENYKDQPALTFIKSVPTNWQQTLVLNADIGKYITIARKERGTDDWYIGGVTDENARDMVLDLKFLDQDGVYKAMIYQDGPGADYRTNPYPMTITQQMVKASDQLNLHLAPSGGFAIQLCKIK